MRKEANLEVCILIFSVEQNKLSKQEEPHPNCSIFTGAAAICCKGSHLPTFLGVFMRTAHFRASSSPGEGKTKEGVLAVLLPTIEIFISYSPYVYNVVSFGVNRQIGNEHGGRHALPPLIPQSIRRGTF